MTSRKSIGDHLQTHLILMRTAKGSAVLTALLAIRLGLDQPQPSSLDGILVVNIGFMLGWLGAMALAGNNRRYVLSQSLAVAAILTLDAVFIIPDLVPLSDAITSAFWILVASALLILMAFAQAVRTVVGTPDVRNQAGYG